MSEELQIFIEALELAVPDDVEIPCEVEGEVDLDTFLAGAAEVLAEVEVEAPSDELLTELFNFLDRNEDGVLDERELCGFLGFLQGRKRNDGEPDLPETVREFFHGVYDAIEEYSPEEVCGYI